MRDAAIDTPRQAQRSGTGRRNANPSGAAPTSAAVAAQRLGAGRTRAGAVPRQSGGRGQWREIRADPSAFSRLKARFAPLISLKAVGGAAFSLVLIGIVANAVWFQRGRHPAPLFATGQTASEAGLPPSPPLPMPRPVAATEVNATAPGGAIAVAASAVTETPVDPTPALPVKTLSTKPVASKPRRDDGIARLLLGQPLASDTGSMAGASTASDKKPDAALLATQRQLVKLGYPVKPDGRMSAGTRGAIEAFERKQHIRAGNDAITPELRRKMAAAVAVNLDKAR